jgi:hypothetical protein
MPDISQTCGEKKTAAARRKTSLRGWSLLASTPRSPVCGLHGRRLKRPSLLRLARHCETRVAARRCRGKTLRRPGTIYLVRRAPGLSRDLDQEANSHFSNLFPSPANLSSGQTRTEEEHFGNLSQPSPLSESRGPFIKSTFPYRSWHSKVREVSPRQGQLA